jgi:hypothetical protein
MRASDFPKHTSLHNLVPSSSVRIVNIVRGFDALIPVHDMVTFLSADAYLSGALG